MHNHPRLESRGKTYWFRAKVPADLRPAYGRKTEVRLSLRTRDKAEAVRLCRLRSLEVDAEFAQKRRQLKESNAPRLPDPVNALTEEDVQRICTLWTHCVLDTDERTRQEGIDEEDFAAMGQRLGATASELRAALARGRVEVLEQALKSFLFLIGIEVDAGTAGYRRLAYVFLQTVTQTLDYQQQRQEGRVVRTEEVAPHSQTFQPGARLGAQLPFEEVFALWKNAVDGRAEGTVRAYGRALDELRGFLRHDDAARVTREDVERYVAYLQDEAQAHYRTVEKKVGFLCSLFERAARKKRIAYNPAARIEIRKPSRPKKARVPYELADLRAIFGSPLFARGERPRGAGGEAAAWLPVLGYYTGARLEELGQLKTADVRRDDELGWYLCVTDGDDDQALKTAGSRRRIPLAQPLIDLGFVRYVDQVLARGGGFLFPDLKPDSKGCRTGNWSKWWGRYARTVIGITDERKTFHSLRHGFKDLCREAMLDSDTHRALTGHTRRKGDASDGYGGDLYPLRPLFQGVRRLGFTAVGVPVLCA